MNRGSPAKPAIVIAATIAIRPSAPAQSTCARRSASAASDSGPAERLERIARIGLRTPAARLSAREQVREQPERRHDERDGHRQRARARLGSPAPQPVERQEQEDLGARERRQRAEHERAARATGEARPGSAEHERDEQRLRHPTGDLARPVRHVVGEQHTGQHGEGRARDPWRAREAHRQRQADLCRADEPHEPGRPHEDEPQLRRRVASERQRRGQQHGQGLPRRAARRVELQVRELASPDEPRPGVVDRLAGEQQRDGRERQAGERGAEKSACRHGGRR
jgi:hypothetical protein